jgi:rod shape-determining protein MreC
VKLQGSESDSLFRQGRVRGIEFIILLIVAIVLMAVDQRSDILRPARSITTDALYPLQRLIDLPSQLGSWFAELVTPRSSLLEENARLERQNVLLQQKLQKFEHLELENQRLRNLDDARLRLRDDRVIVADLIGASTDPYSHHIVLGKGSPAGLREGQPLLDPNGVLGQIIEVSMTHSIGLLVSDPRHAVPVQINRNGLRSIVQGTGDYQRLELQHVPQGSDIEIGDLLVTSGLGGRFPPGYPVGHVREIHAEPGSTFLTITVEPAAALRTNQPVLIVEPLNATPLQALGND